MQVQTQQKTNAMQMSSVAMSANAVQKAAKCCCMHMTANAMMLYNL